ncbi:hypothetical protein RISK_004964 [Rhodopirellula islandica]|uniref:Uncharacterized protein n=1 Tax=Rhodopirellula islandica TaxID=595434 RepID=A0A0J1EBS7_RHOIS|nr:hypothetical protein RISK_004964 [Rhodopirellula islandica]
MEFGSGVPTTVQIKFHDRESGRASNMGAEQTPSYRLFRMCRLGKTTPPPSPVHKYTL